MNRLVHWISTMGVVGILLAARNGLPDSRVTIEGLTSADPKCAEDVAQWCHMNTGYSSNACFEKASEACRGTGPVFSSCVQQTSSDCHSITSKSWNDCFDHSLRSCRGAIREEP